MSITPDLLAAVQEPPSQAFLGALLGAGASLVGGLFARSDAKKRDKAAAEAAKVPVVTSHKVDLPGLVSSAEAAGFNPLTILNAGGLSAFTTTTTTGQNAMAAVPTAPSFGSVLSGAVGKGIDIYREDAQRAADRQVAALSSFPAAPRLDMASIFARTAGGGKAGGGGVQFGAVPSLTSGANDGRPLSFTYEQSSVTNPHTSAYVDPTLADAETSETRYGDSELLSMATGAYTLYSDLVYNLTGSTNAGRNAVYSNAWEAVRSTAARVVAPLSNMGAEAYMRTVPKGKSGGGGW